MVEGPSPARVSRQQPLGSQCCWTTNMSLACPLPACHCHIPRAFLGDVISQKLQHMTAHLEGVR